MESLLRHVLPSDAGEGAAPLPYYSLLTTNYRLLTAHCLLTAAYCLLPTAYCLLPTAYCLLPTAYCPLPTAHCLLLTTYTQASLACVRRTRRGVTALMLACRLREPEEGLVAVRA